MNMKPGETEKPADGEQVVKTEDKPQQSEPKPVVN